MSKTIRQKLEKIRRRRRGFSLVELVVVVALIVVIGGIAVAFLGRSKSQMQRQNVARELKVAFERARFDSVKRRADAGCHASIPPGARARVVITNNSFTLVTDVKEDGSYTSVANSFGGQSISISDDIDNSANTLQFPVTVSFNARGEACTTDNTGAVINDSLYAARFLVCNGTCDYGTATKSNSNLVLVTPTGTVNLLAGNAEAPDFDPPGVSNVDDESFINTLVSLIAGGGSTPVPTPNATPTATPDPTPTISPGGSPTASPTATATPDGSPTATPTVSPTVTPTVSPTATPIISPTPTATATPVGCWMTAPSSVTYTISGNGSQSGTFTVNYYNASGTTITINKSGTPTGVSPNRVNTLSGSGSFPVTVNYNQNSAGTGTVTISGCGSGATVNVTIN